MKNHLIGFVLTLMISTTSFLQAQDRTDSVIFDEPALFEGKPPEEAFRQWICENFRIVSSLPLEHGHGIPCSPVVAFTVTEEGIVSDVKMVRTCDPLLDREVIRTVSSSPKWTPAKLQGVPVKTEHIFRFSVRCIDSYNSSLYHKSKQFYEEYIRTNTRVPAIEVPIRVTVSFVMDETGNVSHINTGGNHIDCEFQYELRRVIASLPMWKDSRTSHSVRVKGCEIYNL